MSAIHDAIDFLLHQVQKHNQDPALAAHAGRMRERVADESVAAGVPMTEAELIENADLIEGTFVPTVATGIGGSSTGEYRPPADAQVTFTGRVENAD